MAGHRKATGRPQRQEPGVRSRSRLESAATAEEQLAAAYDLFRLVARREDPAERARVMREASEFLARLAITLAGRP